MANPWDNDPIVSPAQGTPSAAASVSQAANVPMPWDNDPIVQSASAAPSQIPKVGDKWTDPVTGTTHNIVDPMTLNRGPYDWVPADVQDRLAVIASSKPIAPMPAPSTAAPATLSAAQSPEDAAAVANDPDRVKSILAATPADQKSTAINILGAQRAEDRGPVETFARDAGNTFAIGLPRRLASALNGNLPAAVDQQMRLAADARGDELNPEAAKAGVATGALAQALAVPESMFATPARTAVTSAALSAAPGVVDGTSTTGDVARNAAFGFALGRVLGKAPEIAENPAFAGSGYDLLKSAAKDPAQLSTTLADLGPSATLADTSPSMRGLAQGVVTKPNTGADALVNALESRNASRNVRLADETNANLGPATPPSTVQDTIQTAQKALQPEYSAAIQAASPVNTQGLANNLDAMASGLRGDPQKAAMTVRKMLNAPDPIDPRFYNLQGLDSSPSTLLSTRQAIDGMISTEADPSVIRVLTNARQQVDQALTDAVPGIKAVDAKYEALARQSDALQMGSNVLDAGKTAIWPQELTAQQAAMSPEAANALRTGVRADVENKVGTQANDLAALKKALGGELDWNRDKMGAIFGAEPRDNMVRAINREQRFADTYADVARNSQTAQRLGGSSMIDQADHMPVHNLTWEGLGAAAAQKAYRMFTNSENMQTREQLGHLLSMSGPDLDALVKSFNATRASTLADKLRAPAMTGVNAERNREHKEKLYQNLAPLK